MNVRLAYRLAVATAVVFGLLGAIGIYNFVRAYLDIPSSVVAIENWSVFLIPFFLNVAGFIASAIGLFGGLFGPLHWRYKCAFVFAFGFLCIHTVHWFAVAFGVLRFHGALDLLPLLFGFAWFGWLSVVLWPNYSFKRTAAGRSQ